MIAEKEVKIMASRKYYEATLKRFNAKYQINVSIDAMVELQSSLSALEEEPAMIDYASLLSDVLKIYLDKNTRIKESGTYGIPDFSLGEFIIDFEEVMEEKYRADLKAGQKPTREPYAGANLSDVFSFAGNLVKEYSKPLVSVWAGRIKKGVMSVDTMRAVTDGEYEKLMGIGGKLEQKVKGELDEETMKRLANVVAAREAMEKVRKSRGILWVLANLRINIREWKYMKQLRKACDDLKKNHFPVDSVASQLRAGAFIPTESYDAVNLEKQTKPWRYEVSERFKKMANITMYYMA